MGEVYSGIGNPFERGIIDENEKPREIKISGLKKELNRLKKNLMEIIEKAEKIASDLFEERLSQPPREGEILVNQQFTYWQTTVIPGTDFTIKGDEVISIFGETLRIVLKKGKDEISTAYNKDKKGTLSEVGLEFPDGPGFKVYFGNSKEGFHIVGIFPSASLMAA